MSCIVSHDCEIQPGKWGGLELVPLEPCAFFVCMRIEMPTCQGDGQSMQQIQASMPVAS